LISETTYGGRGGGPTTGRNRRAARRSEEQVEVMHALWAEPHVTFKGKGILAFARSNER
jgi:hypothetical protein